MRVCNSLWRVLVVTLACGFPQWCVDEDVYAFVFLPAPSCAPLDPLGRRHCLSQHNTDDSRRMLASATASSESRPPLLSRRSDGERKRRVSWLPKAAVPFGSSVWTFLPASCPQQPEAHSDFCGGAPPYHRQTSEPSLFRCLEDSSRPGSEKCIWARIWERKKATSTSEFTTRRRLQLPP